MLDGTQRKLLNLLAISLVAILSSPISHAIVGGDAVTSQDPHFAGPGPVVAIFVNGYHHCSGVVIARNKIATARHCLAALTSPLDLRFGLDANHADSVVAQIQAIHQSPETAQGQGDLALITLKENLAENIKAAILPDQALAPDRQMLISGYGCPDMFGSPPGELRYARVRPMGLTSAMITFPSTPETGAFPSLCQGDSGGGTFAVNEQGQLVLLGINSSIGYAGDFSAGMGKIYRLSRNIANQLVERTDPRNATGAAADTSDPMPSCPPAENEESQILTKEQVENLIPVMQFTAPEQTTQPAREISPQTYVPSNAPTPKSVWRPGKKAGSILSHGTSLLSQHTLPKITRKLRGAR